MLEPKVMAMLIVLCEHANTIISSEDLFKRIWPRSIYSPNSVRRNIALLRKLLCDEQKALIKTHPKRGYSLQGAITFEGQNPTADITTPLGHKEAKNKPLHTWVIVGAIIMMIFSALLLFWLPDNNVRQTQSTAVNLKPITSSAALERYMRISPNPNYMAIVRNEVGQNAKRHIYIHNLTDNKTWQVTDVAQHYSYLAWRSKNELIYSTRTATGVEFGLLSLDDNYQLSRHTILFKRSDIDWSSTFFIDNNNNLLYLANHNASEHSRNVTLYKHNLTSGEVTTLLAPNDNFKPYKISLSEDKNTLAMVGFNKQSKSVVQQLDLQSAQLKQIRELDNNWYFLTWHKQKESLLLSNGRQLFELKLNGLWRALNYSNYYFLLYIQKVKDKLYFIEKRADEDIYLVNQNDLNNIKTISDTNALDNDASLSPDETHIAYISTRNGFSQLYLKNLALNTEHLIFDNPNEELSLAPPIWHSNNQQLISALNNRPFVITLTESKAQVTWLEDIIGSPIAWLGNSNTFVFIDKSSQGDFIYEYNLDNAKKQSLQQRLDGRQLIVNNKNQLIVATKNAIENISTKMQIVNTTAQNIRLFPVKTGFYYRTIEADRYQLAFYDYKTNQIIHDPSLEQLCQQFCTNLEAISEHYFVTSQKSSQADIVSLDIVPPQN
ncbi:hypothetical protein HG263_13165 [Pseudoalteromonas sp. JBTF-M23]|uniref:OmpR/PhoB-type domain-containing protein n=1 Tax=Pseudoalteromonas caenipelagi TaxID=2726988 RepID=A0A849VFA2_9GAMM|nr:hypothetical protein [Pseudoalteromonas caenipelagi]